MFYIKVMNKEDNDYSMFTAHSYRVSRLYTDSDGVGSSQNIKAHVILDESSSDGSAKMIEVKSTAYIMSDSGKTIDTIYTN